MAVLSTKSSEKTLNTDPRAVDSMMENTVSGKTCHQCRQKRPDIVGSCITKKREKTCPIKYCPKCLLNRYGEIADEVAVKTDWTCHKCRGNCNCSCCMKKRGQKPTGILVHTAKATGFSSVSELLKTSGSDQYFYKKKFKPEDAVVVASQQNLDQENSVEQSQVSVKKSKKSKREELKDINNDVNAEVKERSPKRIKTSDFVEETEVSKKVLAEGKKKKASAKDVKGNNIADKIAKTKPAPKKKEEDQLVEVKLPQGITSITVSGIDLPPEDVGNVLQFLEFCSAFGKVLDLRKGQSECVIRELLAGRSKRRQQYSTLTQMIIQLLTVLFEDRGETSISLSATDASWFTAVGECLLESDVKLDNFTPEMFEKGISEYEKLDSSKKLQLLNLLCDETLCTTLLRDCIDNHIRERIERRKQAREMINAAKEKEKQLKQKLQDELAKAEAEKNGIPLSISERDAIISRINEEIKEAQSEMQIAIDMLTKESQGNDAVMRTNWIELDDNGLVFWRLNSYNEEQNILVQDLGGWGDVRPHEKWYAFTIDQKPEVEKYINYIRMKRLREQKEANAILKSDSE